MLATYELVERKKALQYRLQQLGPEDDWTEEEKLYGRLTKELKSVTAQLSGVAE